MPKTKKTGEIIKKTRLAKGWNQEKLASRIGGGCTQSRVSQWENGLEPSWLYRRPIVDALEVDPATFGWGSRSR